MAKEDSMIPNSLIEEMFLRVASDEQVTTYMGLIENRHIAVATSYASKTAKRIFEYLVTEFEARGGSIEQIDTKIRKVQGVGK